MKRYIVVSFTLKGQDFKKDILPHLKKIKQKYSGKQVVLIHGFMSEDSLKEKKLSTDVIDELNRLFPEQKRFWDGTNGVVDRDEMRNFAYNQQAEAYIIGDVKEGVKDEAKNYINANMNPIFMQNDRPLPKLVEAPKDKNSVAAPAKKSAPKKAAAKKAAPKKAAPAKKAPAKKAPAKRKR